MSQSTEESYLRAVGSRNLRVDPDHWCDADSLLAAAYVASGDPRKALALSVYRMLATGRTAEWDSVSERLASIMASNSKEGGFLRRGRMGLSLSDSRAISRATLAWKMNSTCQDCHGRGHPSFPGSPHIDTSRTCSSCHGTGITPLERFVRHELIDHARWLASEIDSLCSVVFNDMARAHRDLLSIR